MSHYVYDDTALNFPKIDLVVIAPTAPREQYLISEDWNISSQALNDVKAVLRGGKWYGLESQPTDPSPSGVSDYLWLSSSGGLTVKRGGVNYQAIYGNKLIETGPALQGGATLANPILLDMALLSPSPEGTFSYASLVIDEYGRVVSASSGSAGGVELLSAAEVMTARGRMHVDSLSLVFDDDVDNAWTHLRIADSTVTPGVYALATVTVNQQGIITEIAAGSVPDMAAIILTAGVGLSGGGDLTASRTFDLEDTVVTPGSYTYGSFTVDQQGRLTSAASGAAPALEALVITAGVGLVGGGDLSASRTIDLEDTTVTPGSYTYGSFDVDQQGRITGAANGVAPALASLTLTAGVGLTGGGDLTAPRTFDLEDTAVIPGSFVYAGFTVNQQGRITAAESGAAPALASVIITAGVGLSGGGDLSAPVTIDLEDTAVVPGSYVYGSFTVDQQGRVTAASDGTVPALASLSLTAGVGLIGGGDLSAARTFDLEDTAVTPGSYVHADITIDQQGRITAAADGDPFPPAIIPDVTGSKASGAALDSLLAALVTLGLITDTTSA